MNVLAACAITGAMGLATNCPGITAEDMAEAIKAFQAVEHRLEVVRDIDGVTYVNDSIATAPERLAAALQSYNEPLVLLIGGADKDLPWEAVLALALQKSKHIIVFGQEGKKQVSTKVMPILDKLNQRDNQISQVETLEQAVQRASEIAESGDVVLLSPGGTSYDAYPDFAARGVHFRELVSQL
jgi:UDP-N-acetylmuramoylalanine--D-glutamate ligase